MVKRTARNSTGNGRGRSPARKETSGFATDVPWVPPTMPATRYESPVLRQMRSDVGGWTIEMLAELAPVYQAGYAAQEQLKNDPPQDLLHHAELQQAVVAGEAAKEKLVLAGMSLARSLAMNELNRRAQAGGLTQLDDLMQEAFIGMLKGLRNYDPGKQRESPTNYVSGYITMEMRRGETAKLDSDFSVPVEVSTLDRRIRALRSRLAGDLGREPTPQEISDASADPKYAVATLMAAKGGNRKPKRIPVEKVVEERNHSTRVGPLTRPGGYDDGEGAGPDPYDAGVPLATSEQVGSDERALQDAQQTGVRELLMLTMRAMGLPAVQSEIVMRHHGLAPYAESQTAARIGRELDLESGKVSEVVEAFSVEMARPGGAFHRLCSQRSAAELADLGMPWIQQALGAWDDVPEARQNQPPPPVLVEEIVPVKRRRAPRPVVENTTGFTLAQYQCLYDGADYVVPYEAPEDVLTTRPCPRCQNPSVLLRQDRGAAGR